MYLRQKVSLAVKNFLWEKLMAEKRLREAHKVDPTLGATIEKMDPFEKKDFHDAFQESKRDTNPEGYFDRAERLREGRAEAEADEDSREEAFEAAVRRSRAQLRNRELGAAQRQHRALRKAFRHELTYAHSQIGRTLVVDSRRKEDAAEQPKRAQPPPLQSGRGLFLGK